MHAVAPLSDPPPEPFAVRDCFLFPSRSKLDEPAAHGALARHTIFRRRFRRSTTLRSGIEGTRALGGEQPNERSVSRFEKLYTMLLDSIPSSVLLVDPNLCIVSANRNFVQKARVGGTQVVDRRLEEIFPPFFYQHMSLKSKVEEVFRTGHSITGEHMVYRVSGVPPRFYYYSLLPFRWKGGMENVMLLMEDVTDLVRLGEEARRAERHLASVVESAERSRGVDRSQGSNCELECRRCACDRIRGGRGPPLEHCRPLPRVEPP